MIWYETPKTDNPHTGGVEAFLLHVIKEIEICTQIVTHLCVDLLPEEPHITYNYRIALRLF